MLSPAEILGVATVLAGGGETSTIIDESKPHMSGCFRRALHVLERERERERARRQHSYRAKQKKRSPRGSKPRTQHPQKEGGDKRSTEAAAAAEHIQEAASLARAIELPGVESHLAAAATSLRLTMGELGTRRGQPRPSPNAFEIAALMVGILADQCLTEGETTAADLAEVLELVQAGQGLLWGGVRSSNWQRTHDATDAAEEAEALLQALMETGEPPDEGDLTRLHNQLEAQQTGSKCLWGSTHTRGRTSKWKPSRKLREGRKTHRNLNTSCGRPSSCASSYPSRTGTSWTQPEPHYGTSTPGRPSTGGEKGRSRSPAMTTTWGRWRPVPRALLQPQRGRRRPELRGPLPPQPTSGGSPRNLRRVSC